jgi:hypothetical protein
MDSIALERLFANKLQYNPNLSIKICKNCNINKINDEFNKKSICRQCNIEMSIICVSCNTGHFI